MKFGEILKGLLELKGITQKQLAIDLNMAPSTLGNYIRNLREPDYETLKMIASYFNVTIDYLLDFQISTDSDYRENQLLQIFRAMVEEHKSIYIEQGKVFLRAGQPYREEKQSIACFRAPLKGST